MSQKQPILVILFAIDRYFCTVISVTFIIKKRASLQFMLQRLSTPKSATDHQRIRVRYRTAEYLDAFIIPAILQLYLRLFSHNDLHSTRLQK